MSDVAIKDDDLVVRAALYPRMLKGAQDVISSEGFLFDFHHLGGSKEFELSVGLRSLLPTMDDVHDYGCRTAEQANTAVARRKGAELEPLTEMTHYLGSAHLTVSDIYGSPAQYYKVDLVHCPLDNLYEHCNIVLSEINSDVKKSKRSQERTQIIAHFRSCLFDAESHVCPVDRKYASQLEKVRLLVDR